MTVATPRDDDGARYPSELEREVTLGDGARVWIRPIRSDDAPRLVEFYGRLSRLTAYQRFFSVMKRLPPDWAQLLATVDYRRRLALIAEGDVDGGRQLIAVGRYEPCPEPGTVEVAFVVQDSWQGRGLGTILLHDIMSTAQARGIDRFRAYVLADNPRMLDLLHRFTAVEARALEDGVVSLVFRARGLRGSAP